MSKNTECLGQLHLFDEPTYQFSDLGDVVVSHARNFRIELPYLIEHLSQYNNYLKKEGMDDLKNDNLLLRTMFGGIQNSKNIPSEIFDGLNALEICLMEAGIFKRKSFYTGEMMIWPKGDVRQEPINVRINPPSSQGVSRIKQEGHLDGKHLYEIVVHLLTATDVERIYSKYRKDWQTISQLENPGKKQKRFKRLNPYDPSTLKQRMDYIERTYPDAFWKFRKVLEEPFIPKRVVGIETYETTPLVKSPQEPIIPPEIYGIGIRDKLLFNLREYVRRIIGYIKRGYQSRFGKPKKVLVEPPIPERITVSEPKTYIRVIQEGFITPRTISKCAEEIRDYFQRKERNMKL